jgi:hypothetical protein
METKIPLWVPIAVGLGSSLLVLLGALGSQLIAAATKAIRDDLQRLAKDQSK